MSRALAAASYRFRQQFPKPSVSVLTSPQDRLGPAVKAFETGLDIKSGHVTQSFN